MKRWKKAASRVLVWFLAAALLLGTGVLTGVTPAQAADADLVAQYPGAVASGYLDYDLFWVLQPNDGGGYKLTVDLLPEVDESNTNAGSNFHYIASYNMYWGQVLWYKYKKSITALEIKEGVKGVMSRTFVELTALKSISLPSTFVLIDDEAFSECNSLTELTLNEGLVTLGDYAFAQCQGLTKVNLPSTLVNIGEGAFDYCDALESVRVTPSVKNIGPYAFNRCENLKLTVDPASPYFTMKDDLLMSKDETVLYAYMPIRRVENGEDVFTIPSTVKSVMSYAFTDVMNDGLEDQYQYVGVPEGMRVPGKLKEIVIPASVTYLDFRAITGGRNGLATITFLDDPLGLDGETITMDEQFITLDNEDDPILQTLNLGLRNYKFGPKSVPDRLANVRFNGTYEQFRTGFWDNFQSMYRESWTDRAHFTCLDENGDPYELLRVSYANGETDPAVKDDPYDWPWYGCRYVLPTFAKPNSTVDLRTPGVYKRGSAAGLVPPVQHRFDHWELDGVSYPGGGSFDVGESGVTLTACYVPIPRTYEVWLMPEPTGEDWDATFPDGSEWKEFAATYPGTYSFLNYDNLVAHGAIPTIPEGYRLVGWRVYGYRASKDIVDEFTPVPPTNPSGDNDNFFTMVPVFEILKAPVTITLDPNGGSNAGDPVVRRPMDKYGDLGTAPVREGYYFTGWYTEAEGGERVTADTLVTLETDHSLYAHWHKLVTITFDPNGGTLVGSGTLEFQEGLPYRDTISFPSASWADHGFLGWFTAAEGGDEVTPADLAPTVPPLSTPIGRPPSTTPWRT